MINPAIMARILGLLTYKDCVISFCHDDYRKITAGAQRYVLDQQQMMNGRHISYIALIPVCYQQTEALSPEHLSVEVVMNGESACILAASEVGTYFRELITAGELHLIRIFLHSFYLMSIAMIDAIVTRVRIKKDIEVFHIMHDYHAICRNHLLFYNDASFCGPAPVGSTLCTTCCHGASRQAHYDSINRMFIKHQITIVSPSDNGKKIFLLAYPHLAPNVRVVPHQNLIVVEKRSASCDVEGRRIRVAYAGHPHRHKGWDAWVTINDIPNRSDYDFFHFFYVNLTLPGTIFVDTSFHYGGAKDTTSRLIEHGIDVILLWSNWFGNYNYTYYESLAANCFVLTYKDSGNIADQVRRQHNGLVLDSEDELAALFQDTNQLRQHITRYQRSKVSYRVAVNHQLTDEIVRWKIYD